MLGSIFAKARSSTGLDPKLFARLVEIDAARLAAIEEGAVAPAPDEVDRCALVLGLRVRDLLAGSADAAPMTLLLRSVYEEGRPSLEEMEATGAHKTLGAFLRVVRDIAELEQLLGKTPKSVLHIPARTAAADSFPAEQDARWVREKLDLGIEPIASMRRLLTERLDIRLFFVTSDELDPTIDGAATHTPRRAILVNASSIWWRTRMTLAHEFAHLLFNDTRAILFSPHRTFRRNPISQRWLLFAGFDDMEVRADAFAACFLAPAEGVRKLIGTLEPSSEAAIGRLGKHFGVGRTVAINRLADVFELPVSSRTAMESRFKQSYGADFSDDEIKGSDTGLRSGALVPVVAEALKASYIGKTRAWEYLAQPLTEPIPALGEPWSQPPQTQERWIAQKAQLHLYANYQERSLHVVGVKWDGTSWLIAVAEGGIGERYLDPAGALTLGDDGHIVSEKIIGARSATA